MLERLAGYPPALLERIGHPVMWMGALITALERRLNQPGRPDRWRRVAGVVMLDVLLLATLVPTVAVAWLTSLVPEGWIIQSVLATAFLAQKELGRAVRAVANALDRSLADGRTAVAEIVGRDPETLDEVGVARAAIESLAESTSDGVIAPLFWMLLLGLPGIALYKAINTADSMVGHRDERYRAFGWAAARLDDIVNWIPARLTGLLMVAACWFTRDADAGACWHVMLADAGKHDSPNAGWPEAAMAGALGFTLGGPRSYGGVIVALPSFGRGRSDLRAADIRRALDFYAMVLNVALGFCAVIAVLVGQ